MGWWGKGLLDGDTPTDIYYNVAVDYLNGKHFSELEEVGEIYNPKHKCDFYIFPVIPRQKDIDKAWDRLIKLEDYTYSLIILSLIAMRFGLKLNREKRIQLEHCAEEQMNNAQGDKERERHLTLYIEAVKSYSHLTKWVLEEDGTFTPIEPNSIRFIKDP